MIDLFLEGQLAETAVLLAVLVVAVLAVRTLLRLPAEVKPAPAAAALSPVPPAIPIPPAECAFRHGVTEVEREELMLIAQAHAAGLAPHGGLLALGAAREILAIAPLARERERARLLRHYGKTLEWRKLTAADEVLWRGVPPELLAGAQSESWEFGQTSGGLPVNVHVRNSCPEASTDSPSRTPRQRQIRLRVASSLRQLACSGPHRPALFSTPIGLRRPRSELAGRNQRGAEAGPLTGAVRRAAHLLARALPRRHAAAPRRGRREWSVHPRDRLWRHRRWN
jgi:hypothetical protein